MKLANDRLEEFVPLYQEVKQLDPNHLQSMTTGSCWLSAEQIRKRATVSDIISPDLYNVGQGSLTEHPKRATSTARRSPRCRARP